MNPSQDAHSSSSEPTNKPSKEPSNASQGQSNILVVVLILATLAGLLVLFLNGPHPAPNLTQPQAKSSDSSATLPPQKSPNSETPSRTPPIAVDPLPLPSPTRQLMAAQSPRIEVERGNAYPQMTAQGDAAPPSPTGPTGPTAEATHREAALRAQARQLQQMAETDDVEQQRQKVRRVLFDSREISQSLAVDADASESNPPANPPANSSADSTTPPATAPPIRSPQMEWQRLQTVNINQRIQGIQAESAHLAQQLKILNGKIFNRISEVETNQLRSLIESLPPQDAFRQLAESFEKSPLDASSNEGTFYQHLGILAVLYSESWGSETHERITSALTWQAANILADPNNRWHSWKQLTTDLTGNTDDLLPRIWGEHRDAMDRQLKEPRLDSQPPLAKVRISLADWFAQLKNQAEGAAADRQIQSRWNQPWTIFLGKIAYQGMIAQVDAIRAQQTAGKLPSAPAFFPAATQAFLKQRIAATRKARSEALAKILQEDPSLRTLAEQFRTASAAELRSHLETRLALLESETEWLQSPTVQQRLLDAQKRAANDAHARWLEQISAPEEAALRRLRVFDSWAVPAPVSWDKLRDAAPELANELGTHLPANPTPADIVDQLEQWQQLEQMRSLAQLQPLTHLGFALTPIPDSLKPEPATAEMPARLRLLATLEFRTHRNRPNDAGSIEQTASTGIPLEITAVLAANGQSLRLVTVAQHPATLPAVREWLSGLPTPIPGKIAKLEIREQSLQMELIADMTTSEKSTPIAGVPLPRVTVSIQRSAAGNSWEVRFAGAAQSLAEWTARLQTSLEAPAVQQTIQHTLDSLGFPAIERLQLLDGGQAIQATLKGGIALRLQRFGTDWRPADCSQWGNPATLQAMLEKLQTSLPQQVRAKLQGSIRIRNGKPEVRLELGQWSSDWADLEAIRGWSLDRLRTLPIRTPAGIIDFNWIELQLARIGEDTRRQLQALALQQLAGLTAQPEFRTLLATWPSDMVQVEIAPPLQVKTRIAIPEFPTPVEFTWNGRDWSLANRTAIQEALGKLPWIQAQTAKANAILASAKQWLAQPHTLTLAPGLAATFRLEEPNWQQLPLELRGSGTLKLGQTAVEVRIDGVLLTRLPKLGDSLESLLPQQLPRVQIVAPMTLLSAWMPIQEIESQLGLHLSAMRWSQAGWRIQGRWTPPGAESPLEFDIALSNLRVEQFLPELLRGIAMAFPETLNLGTERVRVTLKRQKNTPQPMLVSYAATLAVAGPIPFRVDCDSLALSQNAGKIAWQTGTIRLTSSANFEQHLSEGIAKLGLPLTMEFVEKTNADASTPTNATASNLPPGQSPKKLDSNTLLAPKAWAIQLQQLDPHLEWRNQRLNLSLKGVCRLKHPPIAELNIAIPFLISGDGLQIPPETWKQLESQLLRTGNRVVQERLGITYAITDALNRAFRAAPANAMVADESGLFLQPEALASTLRNHPIPLFAPNAAAGDAPLQLRITRVTWCRYYRRAGDPHGGRITFWPEVPQRSNTETEAQFADRTQAYQARMQQIRGKTHEYGIRFDADLMLPGGITIALRPSDKAMRETIADPAQRPTAFLFNGDGLQLAAGIEPGVDLPVDAWMAKLADRVPGLQALSELQSVLPIDIAIQWQGLPQAGQWQSIDWAKLGVRIEFRLDSQRTAQQLPNLLQPLPKDGIPLGHVVLTASGKPTVQFDGWKTVIAMLKPMQFGIGPMTLTLSQITPEPGGIAIDGQISGLLEALGKFTNGVIPAQPPQALTVRGVRIGRGGLDLSRASIDTAPLMVPLTAWLEQQLLKKLDLGGLQVRLVGMPDLTLERLLLSAEAKFTLLDRTVTVQLRGLEIRWPMGKSQQSFAIQLDGIRTNALDVVVDKLGETIAGEVNRIIQSNLSQFQQRLGIVSVGLELAQYQPANRAIVIIGTVAVDELLEPTMWSAKLSAAGKFQLESGPILETIATRIGTGAERLITEKVNSVLNGLRIAGVSVEIKPSDRAGKQPTMFGWNLVANTTKQAIELAGQKIALPKQAIATMQVDLRAGKIDVQVNDAWVKQFKQELVNQATVAVTDQLPKTITISLLGETVTVIPHLEPATKRITATLKTLFRDDRFQQITENEPDSDALLTITDIHILSIQDNRIGLPDFSKAKIHRPWLLARWVLAKTGLQSCFRIDDTRSLEDGYLSVDATLEVPGVIERTTVRGIRIHPSARMEEWALAIVNPLLDRLPGVNLRLADGVRLSVQVPRLEKDGNRFRVRIPISLTLSDSPPVRVAADIVIADNQFCIDGLTDVKQQLKAQLKGVLSLALGEFSDWISDGALKFDNIDVIEGANQLPRGFRFDATLGLSFLGDGFGGLSLHAKNIGVSPSGVMPPDGIDILFPVSIIVGPLEVYSLGGGYERAGKRIRIRGKLTLVKAEVVGRIIHLDGVFSMPLEKIGSLRMDSSLNIFGFGVARSFGEIDFPAARISQGFTTNELLSKIILLKANVVLDGKAARFDGELLARLLGCDVATAKLLLDIPGTRLEVAGNINLYIARASANFRIPGSLSKTALDAQASAGLPGLGDLVSLGADLNTSRAKLRAAVLIVKATFTFPYAAAFDPGRIAKRLLELLNPAQLIRGLLELLKGNFNISIGSPIGPGGDGEGGEGPDGTGNSESQGDGKADSFADGPPALELPAGATVQHVPGDSGKDYVSTFYTLNNQRFLRVQELSSKRIVTLRADFGAADMIASNPQFKELESGFGSLHLKGIFFSTNGPPSTVSVQFTGPIGATAEKMGLLTWTANSDNSYAPVIPTIQLLDPPPGPPPGPPPPKPVPVPAPVPPNPIAPPPIITSDPVGVDGNPYVPYAPHWNGVPIPPHLIRIIWKQGHPWHKLDDEVAVWPMFTPAQRRALLNQNSPFLVANPAQMSLSLGSYVNGYVVLAWDAPMGGLQPGILAMQNHSRLHHDNIFYIERVTAAMIRLPANVPMLRAHPKNPQLRQLTPEAAAIASLQVALGQRYPQHFGTVVGKYQSQQIPRQSYDANYTLTNPQFQMEAGTIWYGIFTEVGGKKTLAAVTVSQQLGKQLLDDPRFPRYPWWLITADGRAYAPFDRNVQRLSPAVRNSWMNAERWSLHPDLPPRLNQRNFWPLTELPAEPGDILGIDRGKTGQAKLTVIPTQIGNGPQAKREIELPLPEWMQDQLGGFLRNDPAAAKREVPGFKFKRAGDSVLLTLDANSLKQAMAAAPVGRLTPYPLWQIHPRDATAPTLFALRNLQAIPPDLAPLLKSESFPSHAKFYEAIHRRVVQQNRPLEPLRLRQQGIRWEAIFRQGDRLIVISETEQGDIQEADGLMAAATGASLEAVLQHAGANLESAWTTTQPPYYLLAVRAKDLPPTAKPQNPQNPQNPANEAAISAGPLWIVGNHRTIQPLAMTGAAQWDAANEWLTRPVELAKASALIQQWLEHPTPDTPWLILPPMPPKPAANATPAPTPSAPAGAPGSAPMAAASDGARYLVQDGPIEPKGQGWLIRISANRKQTTMVRGAVGFGKMLRNDPTALEIRDVSPDAETPILLARVVMTAAKLSDWVKSMGENAPYPFWYLTKDSSFAPFLATLPDGKTPIDAGQFPQDAFWSNNALSFGRQAMLDSFKNAANGVYWLSTESQNQPHLRWLTLSRDHRTIRLLNEEPYFTERIACPPELQSYLRQSSAQPAFLRGNSAVVAFQKVTILELHDDAAKQSDPRFAFLSEESPQSPPRYPLWLGITGGKPAAASTKPDFGTELIAPFSGQDWHTQEPLLALDAPTPAFLQGQTWLKQPTLVRELMQLDAPVKPRWQLVRPKPQAQANAPMNAPLNANAPMNTPVDAPVLLVSLPPVKHSGAWNANLLVDQAKHPNIPGVPWRKFALPRDSNLKAFFAAEQPMVQADFIARSRVQPAQHTIWWIGPSPHGGGYLFGPGTADQGNIDLGFSTPSGASDRYITEMKTILARLEADRLKTPPQIQQLTQPREIVLQLSRDVISLADRWKAGAATSLGYQADPRGLFQSANPMGRGR
ncbi:type 1 periplasmic-binding domain-containing protein [Tuwongella immobilis]|uniref:Uncharacterized protein n=1 Tax=Tuwongella immobilis TaxID=692036 RepID=A0A6C2YGN9_9BACT|nr:hypothetical protein [Tuwongella immobilis]VIP00656.1 unnamed protein product [Tuwongella immobilis]VTR96730.1 unnamed protein product [Tuwongella immobilis]